MVISLVVAAAGNQAIGKDNRLLWHLPDDMQFFKSATWAMPVIMGRKTYESLGKALPGRFNIVLTHQKGFSHPDIYVAESLDQAIGLAASAGYLESFVIGGSEIYRLALPLADKIYLTRVDAAPEADSFFPEINQPGWKLVADIPHAADKRHAYSFHFQYWEKQKN
ncbi:MAG TPA: dihydrofolate reductase [Sediminibacterium sp.]|nr:dihydrofolate reductase [Sediminibacterium sp.]